MINIVAVVAIFLIALTVAGLIWLLIDALFVSRRPRRRQ